MRVFKVFLAAMFVLFNCDGRKNLAVIHDALGSVAKPFFQANQRQPYHLSIGAVLFNKEGCIACYHFKEIFGHKDIFILMRESMEDNETPLTTLSRGLREEFGASAKPVAFLGCLSGYLPDAHLPFEKTTLYIACRMVSWNVADRDPGDGEASSAIEWMDPATLISLMKQQGVRFQHRVDADESEMVARALPYIQKELMHDGVYQK